MEKRLEGKVAIATGAGQTPGQTKVSPTPKHCEKCLWAKDRNY
jgi:hypothetical protein